MPSNRQVVDLGETYDTEQATTNAETAERDDLADRLAYWCEFKTKQFAAEYTRQWAIAEPGFKPQIEVRIWFTIPGQEVKDDA